MDVDDVLILVLTLWVVLCSTMVKTTDVFLTLMLIGLLVVMEVGGGYIKPEIKKGMKTVIYILLFIFLIVVARKVLEVLGS